jgi:hypothetical protein
VTRADAAEAKLKKAETEIQRLARAHIKSDDGWADAGERVEELEKIIDDAPHADVCHMSYARDFGGDHRELKDHRCPGCDCWKDAAALKEKS